MIGIVILAAAAQAPLLLASNDETQWRRFVRASLQRPAVPGARDASRLRQLQGVVRSLGDDRRSAVPGPSGL
ncbi:MAG TPA: hypothetical protein VF759_02715 [Allosphingosinicella sp.]